MIKLCSSNYKFYGVQFYFIFFIEKNIWHLSSRSAFTSCSLSLSLKRFSS